MKYFMLLPKSDHVGSPYDALLWSALLKSASAFEMYRKRFRVIHPDRVVEFLMLDPHFSRLMRFSVKGAERSLRLITGSDDSGYANPVERKLGQLRSELDYADIGVILDGGLHDYLDDFQGNLNEIGGAVYENFFALKPVTT